MPNGANAMTSPTNLNITSDNDWHSFSMKSFDGPVTRDSATANRIAKNTTWSTSFFAAASKKLCGTMCSITPVKLTSVFANSAPLSVLATARFTPAPGFTTFTTSRPIASASVVTTSK